MKTAMCTSDRMSKAFQPRRSVPGMKDLLPLQLSSPSLPNIEIWPSPNSIQRSTFGFEERRRSKKGLSESQQSTTRHGNPTRLPLSIRPQQYRDSPICYEPGSPLPKSPTESLHFHYSPPSSCDYTIDDCSSPNTEPDEHDETMVRSTLMSNNASANLIQSVIKAYQENARRDRTSSWASNPTEVSRSSGLSFQCMGEPVFPTEAAWLRSPTARWDGSFSRPRPENLSKSMPESRKIESWFSERSFFDDEEDVLVSCRVSTGLALLMFAGSSNYSQLAGGPVKGPSCRCKRQALVWRVCQGSAKVIFPDGNPPSTNKPGLQQQKLDEFGRGSEYSRVLGKISHGWRAGDFADRWLSTCASSQAPGDGNAQPTYLAKSIPISLPGFRRGLSGYIPLFS